MTSPEDFPRSSALPPLAAGQARQSPSPRPRRRRRGRLQVPQEAGERAARLQSLARRAYPSYELFVFAALCGAILGLGYVLDSQALLLLGVLTAPLLTAWIGLLLATLTGSVRFFLETLMALLISAALVFLIGAMAGLAVRLFLPRTLNEAFTHSRLWWPDLMVLALGAVILTLSFVRSEEKPYLPSAILAYELFLPLSAGGFGLGSGLGGLWPHGVLVFCVHLAWASVFGLLTLIGLRFLPSGAGGALFSAGLLLSLLAALALLMRGNAPASGSPAVTVLSSPTAANPLPASNPLSAPSSTPPPQAPSTPLFESATLEGTLLPTPVPLTLEATLPPSETPTITLTIEPTPVYAKVFANKGGGVVLRETPGGKGITILDNYSIVQVLPETQEYNGYTWAHVIATQYGKRLEGWVVQVYLQMATPLPVWQPSETPTFTPIP